jgi:hypothetical protein
MPRTNVPVARLTEHGLTTPGTTAVDPTNGHELTYVKTSHLFLEVNNTAGTAKNVTIKKATDATLGHGAQPDLVLQVPNAARRFLGPFESARYAQPGGKLWIDLESGITGTIAAYEVP